LEVKPNAWVPQASGQSLFYGEKVQYFWCELQLSLVGNHTFQKIGEHPDISQLSMVSEIEKLFRDSFPASEEKRACISTAKKSRTREATIG